MANLKNTSIDGTVFRLPSGDTAARPTGTNGAQLRFNTETGKLEQFRPGLGAWIAPSNTGVIATGGDSVYDVETEGTTYRVHVFTATGTSTFEVLQGGEVEYLIVAGGGGAGSTRSFDDHSSAGGGAGGLLTGNLNLTSNNYSIDVGEGGIGGTTSGANPGENGGDSSAFSLTATGGGGGGANAQSGEDGASGGGGGGGGGSGNPAGGSGIPGQGNDGGNGFNQQSSSNSSGGGGGGAGGPGENSSSGNGGDGGIGINLSISGTSVFYSGGGGGSGNSPGTGGIGGGGNGSSGNTAEDGVPGTGGGAGGNMGRPDPGDDGGSGIVIIRYPLRQNNPETAEGQDVGNGLVLDLDFAKPTVYSGSGSVVTDGRLNGIEGDLVNGPEFVNPRTHRSAFKFNGNSQYIDIQRDFINSGEIGSGNVSYTLEAWFRFRGTPGSGSPLNGMSIIGSATSNGIGFQIETISGNVRVNFGARGNNNVDSSSSINPETWYHVVCTREVGVNNRIYINGQLDSTDSISILEVDNTTANMQIGFADTRVDDQYFEGEISIARLYNTFLTDNQVVNIFNATRWRFGV